MILNNFEKFVFNYSQSSSFQNNIILAYSSSILIFFFDYISNFWDKLNSQENISYIKLKYQTIFFLNIRPPFSTQDSYQETSNPLIVRYPPDLYLDASNNILQYGSLEQQPVSISQTGETNSQPQYRLYNRNSLYGQPNSVSQYGQPNSVSQYGQPNSVSQYEIPNSISQYPQAFNIQQYDQPSISDSQYNQPSSVSQYLQQDSILQYKQPESIAQYIQANSISKYGQPSTLTQYEQPNSIIYNRKPGAVLQYGQPISQPADKQGWCS